jgi:hypothetical protein
MKYNINGITIETSDRGRSGYLGVTVSPAWTLDTNHPFIACLSNPIDDPVLSKWLTAKERQSLHLGNFGDSREAAYVCGLYKNDPESILKEIYFNGKVNVVFPQEVYDLPEYLSLKDAQTLIAGNLQKKTTSGSKQTQQKFKQKFHINDVLKIAREYTSGKKILNVSIVRQGIEKNLKSFKTKDDVEKYVASVAILC